MKEFEFIDLINGIENLPNELLNYNSILYRIYNKRNKKSYVGTAKYGMPNRLYGGYGGGHVTLYKRKNSTKCQGMYLDMNLNIEDFQLIIEKEVSPDHYCEILSMETKLIDEFDSIINGYNVSIDGKPGWKEGTICVNNEKTDIYIYPENLEHFLNNGYSIGSCKHDFLKGKVFINNGEISRMVSPEELEKYLNNGFKLGNLNIPNKGKIWVNNGIKSKLVNKSQLGSDELIGFDFFGRIEDTPRKKRGSYSAPKKAIVNNGQKEIRVQLDKLSEFLNNNRDFIRGRLKR